MKYDNFKKAISPTRWTTLMDFLHKNELKLAGWAVAKGIVTREQIEEEEIRCRREYPAEEGEEKFNKWKNILLCEVFSRTMGMMALRKRYGWEKDAEFIQMPLSCHYDFIAPDGRRYECKFRTNDSNEYPTDRIDEEKKDWVTTATMDDIDLLYMLWDGIVRVYDFSKPDATGEWEKYNNSVSHYGLNADTKYVTKPYVEWYPSSAIWTATTTAAPLIVYEQ